MAVWHIGEGLKAVVWVWRKTTDVIIRVVGEKFIERQEGIMSQYLRITETAIPIKICESYFSMASFLSVHEQFLGNAKIPMQKLANLEC